MASAGLDLPDIFSDEPAIAVSLASIATVIGEQSLKLLQTAGDFVPVPGIATAANIALSIIAIAQTVKTNKEEFVAVGKEACVIMVTVVQRVNASSIGSVPAQDMASLRQDSDQLLDDMKGIEKVVKKHVKKRSLVKRIIHSQNDQEVVQECRDRLQHALNLFGLQSDLEIRKQLAELGSKLTEVLKNQQTSHSVPQMPQPPTPQPAIPSYPSYPQPSQPSYPHAPYPQAPYPQSPYPGTPHPSQPAVHTPYQSNREKRKAKHQANQQMMNVSSPGPADPFANNSFQNIQNHIAPGANINYTYATGDVNNITRDDSFNVGGTGNSINISFASR